MSKFDAKAMFSYDKNDHTEDSADKVTTFVRDDSDNKLFPEIQVKDIREVITSDCVGHFDFDTTIWKSCANMETKYILVKHTKEGWEEEFKNRTTFKGMGKGIKKGSWLSMKNLDRELEGKPLYELEDFEIEDKAKLKMDKEKALEQAKIQIHMKLKQIRQQFRVPKIKVHIGSGDCFRHDLDLCRPYKGNRSSASRPLILKDIREWVEKELDCEVTRALFEADDRIEHYGAVGYRDYRKTGKFSHIAIASDKDAKNNPKLLIDPDTYVGENNPLRGKYKFPQAMLIEATDRSAGDIGIIQKEKSSDYKFYGFKGLLWQAFCSGDGADNYNALTHLKQDLKFGDESAYRLLKPCKTAKESLQATIDKFAELLPYGVQYQNHKGEDLDVDTITYMDTYFKVAYMTRTYEDSMDFFKLCKAFKVDTGKIENNNLLTPPKKVFRSDVEEEVVGVNESLLQLLATQLSSYKSLKKADLVDKLDDIKDCLTDITSNFDAAFYEMKQEVKDLPLTSHKNKRSLQSVIDSYNKENGYEIGNSKGDYEYLSECIGVEVSTEITSEHRWYDEGEITYKVVIDGEDRFFKSFYYHITGDGCAADMDLDMPTMKDVYEVYPKQVNVTVYE